MSLNPTIYKDSEELCECVFIVMQFPHWLICARGQTDVYTLRYKPTTVFARTEKPTFKIVKRCGNNRLLPTRTSTLTHMFTGKTARADVARRSLAFYWRGKKVAWQLTCTQTAAITIATLMVHYIHIHSQGHFLGA